MTPPQNTKSTCNEDQISTNIISLYDKEILSYHSKLTAITKKGLTLHSSKKCLLVPETDIAKFVNHPVELFLSKYELPFHGVIKKIDPMDKDLFKISVGFTENTPLYYRECMEDLLN